MSFKPELGKFFCTEMNENHVGSRQKGVKSPNQNGCWQYSYLQIMDVLLLIFVARNLAGNVLASC